MMFFFSQEIYGYGSFDEEIDIVRVSSFLGDIPS